MATRRPPKNWKKTPGLGKTGVNPVLPLAKAEKARVLLLAVAEGNNTHGSLFKSWPGHDHMGFNVCLGRLIVKGYLTRKKEKRILKCERSHHEGTGEDRKRVVDSVYDRKVNQFVYSLTPHGWGIVIRNLMKGLPERVAMLAEPFFLAIEAGEERFPLHDFLLEQGCPEFADKLRLNS